MDKQDYQTIRNGIGLIPGDVSHDAVGAHAPALKDIYFPETHAAALDPSTPIVVGSRGTGKSFWAGVLGQSETREAAAAAYPRLGLDTVTVDFGYTGIGGTLGTTVDALNEIVPEDDTAQTRALAFWWATILRSADAAATGTSRKKLSSLMDLGANYEAREDALANYEAALKEKNQTLLIVYDALDTVATSWARRRSLTEALIKVVWATRAYRAIKVKLFLRPDQIDDDALQFVELPKLRTGAIRLSWPSTDLYGLLFARLALDPETSVQSAFAKLLNEKQLVMGTRQSIFSRTWSLISDASEQRLVMDALAGPFMAQGAYGYKKGRTYDWPLTHLADAAAEVTPRSFLNLLISAAKSGPAPDDKALTPDGIRHGLRAASKTRVDQLHQEFPWIKAVLVPLAGLLLPQGESEVFRAWKTANTVSDLVADAKKHTYLLPFPADRNVSEADVFGALERINVMFRRKDHRLDMPDLFRVAAKLLKKGGIAPANS